jgi:hypothetical protein
MNADEEICLQLRKLIESLDSINPPVLNSKCVDEIEASAEIIRVLLKEKFPRGINLDSCLL